MTEPGVQPLRILHAPRNVAGQAGDVVAALRRLGHEAELWEERPEAFGRSADRVLDQGDRDARSVWTAITEAVDRFDVVHFHFGQTLVPRGFAGLPPFWDLPVYRSLGLRVYFTFHGSEVRIGRIHGEMNPWSRLFAGSSEPDDDHTEKSIQVMRTYADRMFVVSVNYLRYVPDAAYLPRVIDLSRWPVVTSAQRQRPVIVHAPTRRGTKGTDLILAGLERLRAEGLEFELRLLEGVPHDRVRGELADADVLVDNVIAGSYGIVSLEAMACGKVAVANLSEDLRAAHPDVPVVDANPDTFADTMRLLIRDPERRQALAARGRPFVERVHDADVIAGRLVEAYRAPRVEALRRTMPDWMSSARVRRIETLETRMGRLETDLARTRRREADLRRRLGLDPQRPPSRLRRLARRFLPVSVRSRLRGALRQG